MNKNKKKKRYPERKTIQSQVTGAKLSREYGGPNGLEPTRYGDWERKGRCIDF